MQFFSSGFFVVVVVAFFGTLQKMDRNNWRSTPSLIRNNKNLRKKKKTCTKIAWPWWNNWQSSIFSPLAFPDNDLCTKSNNMRKLIQQQVIIWFTVVIHSDMCFGTYSYSMGTLCRNLCQSLAIISKNFSFIMPSLVFFIFVSVSMTVSCWPHRFSETGKERKIGWARRWRKQAFRKLHY